MLKLKLFIWNGGYIIGRVRMREELMHDIIKLQVSLRALEVTEWNEKRQRPFTKRQSAGEKPRTHFNGSRLTI